ncbi:hypothetical protein [Luteimonas sp. R10]|uniref:hypothetical protein n=1 Tax=Luteimonas sp. R10 TaxID=3108176 RepID=UPI00308D0823|nr:hypothetical protein U3649_17610 [Luteimonas sp. R10]
MPNPWLRWLCLRGSLQALPPAWPPALALWAAALAMMLAVELAAPGPPRGGLLAAPLEAMAEIALCWLLLRVFRRRALLLPALQALAMAAAVRTAVMAPLPWLAALPPPEPATAGRMLLAVVCVLVLQLAASVWLLRYWFRLWRQALATSRTTAAAVMGGMAAVLVLLNLGLAW